MQVPYIIHQSVQTCILKELFYDWDSKIRTCLWSQGGNYDTIATNDETRKEHTWAELGQAQDQFSWD